jgi:phosphatidylserine decarboxylase
MIKQAFRTKLEEIRLATCIHGGLVPMCVAAMGVKLSRLPIPSRRLRTALYRKVFGKKYSALDEGEFDRPIGDYPSLNALFTRGVRPECRPIAEGADQFLSPCDGRVQEIGRLDRDRLLTVKGVEYTVESLLPGIDTAAFHDGHYAIVFLSPVDCHRVFSPREATIEEIIHVPGYRLLVHPPYQSQEYPVFALNERVILRLATALGPCVVVMVAGWGVGNLTMVFDPAFRGKRRSITRKSLVPPVPVQKGEWLATFELGSTAILLTAPAEHVTTLVDRDDKVNYGQPLFRFDR